MLNRTDLVDSHPLRSFQVAQGGHEVPWHPTKKKTKMLIMATDYQEKVGV